MAEKPVAEDDGVLRRERLTTARADPRLLFHPDSRQQAGCQRAMPARLREITGDARSPVEEGRNCRPPWKNDTAANSTGSHQATAPMRPQHPRALGVGRRSRGEQVERDEQRGPSQSHHRLPSSAVARLTPIRSCAPHVRRSVTSGWPTL
jgi:hypothetical protein